MGRRLRELRLERQLQQGDIARRLGVSAAYLSLIEKGKRPVQLPLLCRALELYGVELESFMQSLGEDRVDDGLARLLDEPLLRTLSLRRQDLAALGSEPRVATTIASLFNLYKNTRSQLDLLLDDVTRRAQGVEGEFAFDYTPFDEVGDFLEQHRNHFPALEARAERFRRDSGFGDENVESAALERALKEALGVSVVHESETGPTSVIRRYDPARGVLTVASDLVDHRRKFQLAHTIGLRLLDEERLSDEILATLSPRHTETAALIKIHLANYLAGALLLPYGPFYERVTRLRYDVERLTHQFGTGYETVAHRMCNLADPKRAGIPLHFLRVDVAGNISKRYAATGLRFPHRSGSCPKWAVHTAFLTPHAINRQYSEFPDGSRYFCFARVLAEPKQGSLARGTLYAIGLGTHADAAKHLSYADDMPLVHPERMTVPVGTTCRFCERTDCNQRAAPSYKFAFRVDAYTKKDNFFSPLVSGDVAAPTPDAGSDPSEDDR